MATNACQPGSPAPHSGEYEELNIFGAPTNWSVFVEQDKPLPRLPRGFMWRPCGEAERERA